MVSVGFRRAGSETAQVDQRTCGQEGAEMIGYPRIEDQADCDFDRARRRALLRRMMARLQRDPASNRLLSFEKMREELRTTPNRVYLGMRVVPVGQIGGSVGRHADFDRDFLPARASVRERWTRIDLAFHRGEELPPVSLYKIGGLYFVTDGHHRVSVARYHGVQWIDAEVTEIRLGKPTDPERTIPARVLESGTPGGEPEAA